MLDYLRAESPTFLYVLGGVSCTLKYTFLSFIGGIVLGTFLAVLKVSPSVLARRAAQIYTSVFRGTPMLVQLSMIYFGAPSLVSYRISPLLAGVIAFSLNSAAYVSEIIRTGIRTLDRGQFEAAQALSIPFLLMMKDIIIPQAFRNVLPALFNELINLLKETALISFLGEEDIMRRAQLVSAETYAYFKPLVMAAFCYYFMILILSGLGKKLEKSMSYD